MLAHDPRIAKMARTSPPRMSHFGGMAPTARGWGLPLPISERAYREVLEEP
jgi:hypothetical protein